MLNSVIIDSSIGELKTELNALDSYVENVNLVDAHFSIHILDMHLTKIEHLIDKIREEVPNE
jgi:septation ring formation regulator EzrA